MILRLVCGDLDRETYERLRTALDIDRNHPLGLIMHGATEVDGRMQVAQVWESDDYARRFVEERLSPTLEELGIPLEAAVTVFELQHLVTP